MKALGIIWCINPINAYAVVGRRRMYETMVTNENADVGERCAAGVEKHEIARAEVTTVDWPPVSGDGGGVAIQPDTGCLLEDVGYHAAAVEAGFRVLPAKSIAGVDQPQGEQRDFVAQCRMMWLCRGGVLFFCGRRHAAARGEEANQYVCGKYR